MQVAKETVHIERFAQYPTSTYCTFCEKNSFFFKKTRKSSITLPILLLSLSNCSSPLTICKQGGDQLLIITFSMDNERT
jgi:hypothetical protein